MILSVRGATAAASKHHLMTYIYKMAVKGLKVIEKII